MALALVLLLVVVCVVYTICDLSWQFLRGRKDCPVAGCQLWRGHPMPCWDGAPDPKRGERL